MAAARPAGATRQSKEQGYAEAGRLLRPKSPGQKLNRAGISWAALEPQSWTTAAGGNGTHPKARNQLSAGAQLHPALVVQGLGRGGLSICGEWQALRNQKNR